LAATEAVGALNVPTLMGSVTELLRDPDVAVRIEAARVLGAASYRGAAPIFRDILSSRAIRNADRREKIAFFESYGRLGDPEAVDLLDGYLNGRGFLGRRESSDIRASSALGLGRVGTSEAMIALDRAHRDDDAVVRSAVTRALQMERRTGAGT
ncbi:MAG TPA: HEAT repeat domain-containing protein, partial [Longimicrobiales bacterium]|nr:HEAT repeat domain-containing protein [Longimicrobiales bacterium]